MEGTLLLYVEPLAVRCGLSNPKRYYGARRHYRGYFVQFPDTKVVAWALSRQIMMRRHLLYLSTKSGGWAAATRADLVSVPPLQVVAWCEACDLHALFATATLRH